MHCLSASMNRAAQPSPYCLMLPPCCRRPAEQPSLITSAHALQLHILVSSQPAEPDHQLVSTTCMVAACHWVRNCNLALAIHQGPRQLAQVNPIRKITARVSAHGALAAAPAARAGVAATKGMDGGAAGRAAGKLACPAYVGTDAPLAGEYYSHDFDWEEHAREVAYIVDTQWAAAVAAGRAGNVALQAAGASSSPEGAPSGCCGSSAGDSKAGTDRHAVVSSGSGSSSAAARRSTSPAELPAAQQGETCRVHSFSAPLETAAATATAGTAPLSERLSSGSSSSSGANRSTMGHVNGSSSNNGTDAQDASTSQAADLNEWERFYRAHPRARFFKERRYLLLEFAKVLGPEQQVTKVLEIGAGCGSAILPILRSHPAAAAVACDVSSTCLQQLQEAAALLGMPPSRVQAFVADGTDPNLGTQLAAGNCQADVALIMFTLSAVMPGAMPQMLRNALLGLRPGGALCIRDHGLYDMVQLRIPPEQCIGESLYRRGDGTLAYFFQPQQLAAMAQGAGFEVEECDYACVYNRNHKTGQVLKRVFVHGLFRRPASGRSR